VKDAIAGGDKYEKSCALWMVFTLREYDQGIL
jgi:hypothetical protein